MTTIVFVFFHSDRITASVTLARIWALIGKNSIVDSLIWVLTMVIRVTIILIILVNFDWVGKIVLLIYNHLVVTLAVWHIFKDLIHYSGVALTYGYNRGLIKHLLLLLSYYVLVICRQVVITMTFFLSRWAPSSLLWLLTWAHFLPVIKLLHLRATCKTICNSFIHRHVMHILTNAFSIIFSSFPFPFLAF